MSGTPQPKFRRARSRRKAIVNAVARRGPIFTENFASPSQGSRVCIEPDRTKLDFVSVNPSVVKSIKQRDLLNTWLRLYARDNRMPAITEYQRERLGEELPDLVFYSVDGTHEPPRLTIQSDGTRMSTAYGRNGKGRLLDEYVGPHLAPLVMPAYYACLKRRLPVYTISHVEDIYRRIVAYERLLLPFSKGDAVTDVIASLKTISEDGGFEIKNLMRGDDAMQVPVLRSVIDRDLFY